MKGKTNASGGRTFAVIDVTYPAGAACTCTNGVRTMQAKDTSGRWMFVIPRAGEWTVTAENEGTSKSETVNVTESKAYTADIKFTLILYESGSEHPETTGAWQVTSSSGEYAHDCKITKNADNMAFAAGYHSTGSFSHSQPIDMSRYATMHILGKFDNSASGGSGTAGVSTSNSGTGFNASAKLSKDSVYIQRNIDISGIMSSAYFKVYLENTDSFTISKIWLD